MNPAIVLSKVPSQAAAGAAASVMTFCLACNTPAGSKAMEAASNVAMAFRTRSVSTMASPAFTQTAHKQHAAGCGCVTCHARGIHTAACSCADCSGAHGATCACNNCRVMKMAVHQKGCTCGSCSSHGQGCVCGSCSTHGPGCVCSSCRM
jgi:hypothetical protein